MSWGWQGKVSRCSRGSIVGWANITIRLSNGTWGDWTKRAGLLGLRAGWSELARRTWVLPELSWGAIWSVVDMRTIVREEVLRWRAPMGLWWARIPGWTRGWPKLHL